jgi:Protein of unknown function (DUF2795)
MVTDIWVFRGSALGADLTGFDVDATDGRVGRVVRTRDDIGLQHLVVDAQPTLPGNRPMIIPAGLVRSVDRNIRQVRIDRDRNELRNAPAYDDARGIDLSYRASVDTYFQPSESRPAARRQRSRSRSAQRRRSEEPTKAELYEEAKRLDIDGRSKLSKAELARAVGRARGGRRAAATRGRQSRQKASPVNVQAFLEGVKYPTERGQLLRQAKREGASEKIRSTIERLPKRKFKDPTAVSEAIGNLR